MLRRQRGMWLCGDCVDDLSKIKYPRPRFFSPRDNSTSVDSVNEPTIFTISAGTGINSISQSREYTREGGRSVYHMYVVSDGGAIDISAVPQIVAGTEGDILTLSGTSDTDTILLEDTAGVALIGGLPMVLTDRDSITFVYNEFEGSDPGGGGWGISQWGDTGFGFGGTTAAWVEVSRTKEAF